MQDLIDDLLVTIISDDLDTERLFRLRLVCKKFYDIIYNNTNLLHLLKIKLKYNDVNSFEQLLVKFDTLNITNRCLNYHYPFNCLGFYTQNVDVKLDTIKECMRRMNINNTHRIKHCILNASETGKLDIIEHLMINGSNDRDIMSYCNAAAKNNHTHILKYFAEEYSYEINWNYILYTTTKAGHINTTKYILKKSLEKTFIDAIKDKDIDTISNILDKHHVVIVDMFAI